MKYLKRFNEELEPYTYRKASDKLRRMGHSSRADRLSDWSNKRQEDENIKFIQRKKSELSNTPSFHMKFFADSWPDHATEPYFEGNFFVDFVFDYDTMINDEDILNFEMNDTATIQFPILIGLMPSDDETKNNLENSNIDVHREMIWPINFCIRLNSNSKIEDKKSSIFWDESNDGVVIFSDRKEAFKFRKFLLESFNSDNRFGKMIKEIENFIKDHISKFESRDKYYWKSIPRINGVYQYHNVPKNENGESEILTDKNGLEYYWPFGDKKESNLRQIDMIYIKEALKKLPINNLYRD
jgi:hypothetical protein